MTTLSDIVGTEPQQFVDWDLREVKHLINRKFYPLLMDRHRFLVLVGGAGSGKSHFIAQNIILRILVSLSRGIKHNILALRKTGPSARYSVFALFKHYINEWNIRNLVDIKETTMEINWMGGSAIRCTGIDDPEKIKSYENLTSVWAEESTDFRPDDITQLNLRLRGKKLTKKQIYLSFNPIDSMSWLRERFFDGDEPKENDSTANVIHSTYQDNEFLNDPDYEAELEALEEQDDNLYKIYARGLWGMLKNLFYTKWREIGDEDWPAEFDDKWYGLDFGDAHPMVLIEFGKIEDEIYERELLFESRIPIDTIPVRFDALDVDKYAPIYADPSRPDLIRLVEDGGYNIFPADNDVKAGIALVQTKCPNIHASSINYLRQRKAYKRKEDRNGNVFDWIPVKIRDDGPDAERYGLYTYFSEMDLIPRVLGHL